MHSDEQIVVDILKKHGLAVEKIKRTDSETPDFRVSATDGFCFFAEVKAIEGPGESEPLMWDTFYNSISNRLHEATNQLKALNPEHLEPNVIMFVAKDFRFHCRSLGDFFEGAIAIGDEVIKDLKRFRFGKVRADLNDIDLCILVEVSGTPQFFYTGVVPDFAPKLAHTFGHIPT